ncbi:MAG: DUF4214 domain-containing protein [Cyanobacteria bacterium]|nr:DUF4214 domain-containing protein [Cyanobacteria bacterium CG_2015-16_32_12]NCO77154.1 DUF4214 domain-containing protein [Cyanobacteria bacterium CG_2015-22_32_23]NCQ04689.1 DUF4214 domain-containing protein [Cyanobacteria bacterium CG_2015-09_32_10]NCQ41605.1 DUF4214 domain-containing protein [Cyanobacteria bacterium CG_2015-04_32_10]
MANFNFGVIDGDFFTSSGNLTQLDNNDTFFFRLENNDSVINVNLFNIIGGDADIELYEDSNFNGILDATDSLLDGSSRTGTQEEVIKRIETASDYFVKVVRFDGNSIDYDLSLTMTEGLSSTQTAINLSPNNQRFFSDFLRGITTFPQNRQFDAIEYTTSANGTIFGQITTNVSDSQFNIKVFDDTNSNGIFDTRDLLLTQKEVIGQTGFINVPVETGRGFVQIENLSNTGYDYSIAANYLQDNPTSTNTSPLTLQQGTAQIAYVAYYGRPADPSGVNFWNQTLGNGNVNYSPRSGDILTGNEQTTYDRIVNDFGNSAEANRLFGGLSNSDKVNQVYNFAFGRDAEASGLNFWTTQLNNGGVTLATFALEVALGAQNQDIIVLRNKIASADLFSQSINTQGEINAYSGSTGEVFGRNWLDPFDNFISLQGNADTALSTLSS